MKLDKRKMKLNDGEIIPICYDFLFTQIFNNPDNIGILEYLLSAVTEYAYSDIQGHLKILPRDLSIENKQEQSAQIDLLLDLNGKKINIEVSNGMTNGVLGRNIIYGCKIHGKQLIYGDNNYSNIKSTLQIQLNNFRCSKKIKSTYYLREEEGKILSKDLRIDVIDMALGRELWYTSRDDKLMRWCKLLTATTLEEFKEALGDDLMDGINMERFFDELIKFEQDDRSWQIYMKLSKHELEHNTIVEDCRKAVEEAQKSVEEAQKNVKETQKASQEAVEKIKIETKEEVKSASKNATKEEQHRIARELKKIGMPTEEIATITKLSKKDVEYL